jgi:hypothetical protein
MTKQHTSEQFEETVKGVLLKTHLYGFDCALDRVKPGEDYLSDEAIGDILQAHREAAQVAEVALLEKLKAGSKYKPKWVHFDDINSELAARSHNGQL